MNKMSGALLFGTLSNCQRPISRLSGALSCSAVLWAQRQPFIQTSLSGEVRFFEKQTLKGVEVIDTNCNDPLIPKLLESKGFSKQGPFWIRDKGDETDSLFKLVEHVVSQSTSFDQRRVVPFQLLPTDTSGSADAVAEDKASNLRPNMGEWVRSETVKPASFKSIRGFMAARALTHHNDVLIDSAEDFLRDQKYRAAQRSGSDGSTALMQSVRLKPPAKYEKIFNFSEGAYIKIFPKTRGFEELKELLIKRKAYYNPKMKAWTCGHLSEGQKRYLFKDLDQIVERHNKRSKSPSYFDPNKPK